MTVTDFCTGQSLDCDGFRKLSADVKKDMARNPEKPFHDYRGKLEWAVSRAKHYAEKTGLTAESILDAWESRRDYWYMNYYQECQQPEIKADHVRVFDTVGDLLASIGSSGFRCPACSGISKSPYECDSGLQLGQKQCDWKAYGLLGHMGKGIAVFVKEKLRIENIFMPVAWEPCVTQHP